MNLIGISGKAGSGKDTTGEIIQKLCLSNKGPQFEIKKFAGKLKQTASLLTGIPIEKFEDQEFKKTILGSEWGKPTKQNPLNAIEPFKDITFVEMMSVRDLLQKLGTEAMRNGLHENTWVNALFADYEEKFANKGIGGFHDPITYKRSLGFPNWIITDVRFPNEFKAIKEKGGIVIRVNRPGHSNSMKELAEAHPSETALDGHDFDYVIENDGNLEKLIDKVKKILLTENIIK
jgi:hypothetical protein